MVHTARAVIVADGDADAELLQTLAVAEPPPRLIAADAGAGRVLAAGLTPELVVGDLDSISRVDRALLDTLGVEVRQARADKDESDMELCVAAALKAGATDLTLLGATGVVRPEHSIANLLLLADPRLDAIDVCIAGHGSTVRRIGTADGPGAIEIEGAPEDFVSLLPIGGVVRGVSTDGLRFPLRGEDMPLGSTRGLSNEITHQRASVRSERGLLLVIHTDARAENRQEDRPWTEPASPSRSPQAAWPSRWPRQRLPRSER